MQPLKAQVKNKHFVIEEPTDLPEGQVIDLVSIEDDGLDDEQRAALHAELEACVAEMKTGARIDAETMMSNLRARP